MKKLSPILLFGILSCSTSVKVNHEFQLVRADRPVRDALVFCALQGRNVHWWEDPTISGDWETPLDERMGLQKFEFRTDSFGRFRIQGEGVYLSVAVVSGTAVLDVLSCNLKTDELPEQLNLAGGRLLYPVGHFISAQRVLLAQPSVHDYVVGLQYNYNFLNVCVQNKSGEYYRKTPYELVEHNSNRTVERFVTDWTGSIRTFIPKGLSVDIHFPTKFDDWPGLNPDLPLSVTLSQELIISDIYGDRQLTDCQNIVVE